MIVDIGYKYVKESVMKLFRLLSKFEGLEVVQVTQVINGIDYTRGMMRRVQGELVVSWVEEAVKMLDEVKRVEEEGNEEEWRPAVKRKIEG